MRNSRAVWCEAVKGMGAVVKSFGWVLFLGFVFVEVFAIRPRLVDEKLWFINQTILNIEYEAAVVQMEFDQELYLRGESFICGLSEKDCPETNCVPCDWSSQQVFSVLYFLFFIL